MKRFLTFPLFMAVIAMVIVVVASLFIHTPGAIRSGLNAAGVLGGVSFTIACLINLHNMSNKQPLIEGKHIVHFLRSLKNSII